MFTYVFTKLYALNSNSTHSFYVNEILFSNIRKLSACAAAATAKVIIKVSILRNVHNNRKKIKLLAIENRFYKILCDMWANSNCPFKMASILSTNHSNTETQKKHENNKNKLEHTEVKEERKKINNT